jgi:hypothetical protein
MLLVVALILAGLIACGSGEVDEREQAEPEKPPASSAGDLSWDDIPVYPRTKSADTEPCPVQWSSCETCESRIWLTNDSPEDVCPFCKQEMPKKGWAKLTYQYFPEGSCTGTWMADMGDSDGPRVILGVGQTARGEDEVQIGITMGSACP